MGNVSIRQINGTILILHHYCTTITLNRLKRGSEETKNIVYQKCYNFHNINSTFFLENIYSSPYNRTHLLKDDCIFRIWLQTQEWNPILSSDGWFCRPSETAPFSKQRKLCNFGRNYGSIFK